MKLRTDLSLNEMTIAWTASIITQGDYLTLLIVRRKLI